MAIRNLTHINPDPQDMLNPRFLSDALIRMMDLAMEQIRVVSEIHMKMWDTTHPLSLNSPEDHKDSLKDTHQKTKMDD